MKDFSLEIGNLNFSLEECNYREINCTIMDLWEGMKNKFSFEIAEDLEIQDRGVCIASLRTTGKSTIDECIKEGIVKLLVNNQIYTYDFQHITHRVCQPLLTGWMECLKTMKVFSSMQRMEALRRL